MEKTTNDIFLTAKELQAFGADLNDLTNEISLNNIAIDGLEVIKRKDPETFMFIITKYLNTTYAINEKVFQKLDEIAYMLINVDNERELEAFRNERWNLRTPTNR